MNPKYICVLDFETTCNGSRDYVKEIIEFPGVLLEYDGKSYTKISSFQRFCKPKVNLNIHEYYHKLTGITQEQIDTECDFPDIMQDFEKWIDNYVNDDAIILTFGDRDLATMMEECKRWNISPRPIYNRYINIRQVIKDFFNHEKQYEMDELLKMFGYDLVGHHSGIDDCCNIATLWCHAVKSGYVLTSEHITINEHTIQQLNKNTIKQLKEIMNDISKVMVEQPLILDKEKSRRPIIWGNDSRKLRRCFGKNCWLYIFIITAIVTGTGLLYYITS
jgi:inhibitor of KinA sporulation pathway (predicted exonuclease)